MMGYQASRVIPKSKPKPKEKEREKEAYPMQKKKEALMAKMLAFAKGRRQDEEKQ